MMARAKAKKAPRRAPRRAAKPLRKKTAAKRTVKPAERAARKAGAGAAKTGSNAAIRAMARRIIDVTLANDDEATLALYAADVQSSEAGQPPQVGIEALRQKFAGWRNLTRDNVFEPRRVCVDGNVVMIEWVGHVTIAASGKQTEMREVAIHEIENGKIVREAFYYNPASLGLG
jgi:ketosteroid isomerase-like protein